MIPFEEIKTEYSYDTGVDNVLEDFYIPHLQNAKRYDRITGFFSSGSLAVAARGIAGLIENKGTMRLVCCPRLSHADITAIKDSVSVKDDVVNKSLLHDLENIEDEFQRDHVAALGWMLANGYLEMRIIILKNKDGSPMDADQVENSPILHQKVGIMYDEDFNALSFSGSNNESASGWLYNDEEFKVFKSWEPGQKDYFEADKVKFEKFWSGTHPNAETKDLPTAIKDNLIKASKDFDLESVSLDKYKERIKKKTPSFVKRKKPLSLFFYQEEAVEKWVNCGRKMLLEMVTGSGKTRTAIGCMQNIFKDEKRPVLCVIACPQTTLSLQWQKDINGLDIRVDEDMICDGTNPKWRTNLPEELAKLSTGLYDNFVIYTTHDTCCSKDFISTISTVGDEVAKMFIGDEVHGMGSPERKRGLLPEYEYRVGCSATPSRWFDELGTQRILDYFEHNKFEFTIMDALTKFNPVTNKHFLVSYYYYPHFVSMTEDELYEYQKLTRKIIRYGHWQDKEELRERLLFQRANIEKNAENKYPALEKILDDIGQDISDTIIFVSYEQIDKVISILSGRGIICHPFTMKQDSRPSAKYGGLSEREHIINLFKSGDYQVLVAIKCLDEGIDIPSAKRAIIMASSTNPREYVQRIGRIIRQAEGKKEAYIHDLIIKPNFSGYKDENLEEFEKSIFKAELNRVKDISFNAMNNVNTKLLISKISGEVL